MRMVTTATARWDTDSDPSNPGWVVDVRFRDGEMLTLAPAPAVYHRPQTWDPLDIVARTLIYEGLSVDQPGD